MRTSVYFLTNLFKEIVEISMSKHLDYKLSSLWTSVTFDCWPCSHGLCSLFFLGHPLALAETLMVPPALLPD